MKRMGITVLLLMATCAVSAVAATNAWAGPAPRWEGKEKKGITFDCVQVPHIVIAPFESEVKCEKKEGLGFYFGGWLPYAILFGRGTTVQKFSNADESVECSSVADNGGIFNDESTGVGRNDEEYSFSGCKVWKGAFKEELPECNVTTIENGKAGSSKTIKVISEAELVYLGSSKAAAEEGTARIGDVLRPPGTSKALAELDFTGTGCSPAGEEALTGTIVSEIEPEREAVTSATVTFPTSAVGEYWKWTTSKVIKESSKAETFGVTTTQSGKLKVELTSKEAFGAFS
jgi:hypothetical protein